MHRNLKTVLRTTGSSQVTTGQEAKATNFVVKEEKRFKHGTRHRRVRVRERCRKAEDSAEPKGRGHVRVPCLRTLPVLCDWKHSTDLGWVCLSRGAAKSPVTIWTDEVQFPLCKYWPGVSCCVATSGLLYCLLQPPATTQPCCDHFKRLCGKEPTCLSRGQCHRTVPRHRGLDKAV